MAKGLPMTMTYLEEPPQQPLLLEPIIFLLKQANEYKLAESLLEVFTRISSNIEQWDNLGKLFMQVKAYDKSLHCLNKCMELLVTEQQQKHPITENPEEEPSPPPALSEETQEILYAIRSNLSKVYNHLNKPLEALYNAKINIEQKPYDLDAHLEQVFAYYLLNRKDISETILRQMLEVPNLPDEVKSRILFNLGTYEIRKGNFLQGLYNFYVIGKQIGIWPAINTPLKEWTGGLFFDQTVVIYSEGGIGDEIVNVRFMKNITEMGMNPVWFTPKKDLRKVFNRNGFPCIDSLEDVSPSSLYCAGMGLPLLLKLQTTDLWKAPYLKADSEYVQKWDWLEEKPKKKLIGLKWFGNPLYDQDLHRSLPLNDLLHVLKQFKEKYPDVEFVSLQLETMDPNIFPKELVIHQVGDRIEDFEDTLAILEHCDLVITSCTSIVHAASAMDKKVVVLVPISTYYIWESTDDHTSPWYSENTHVLRQVQYDHWKEPMDQLSDYLNTTAETWER